MKIKFELTKKQAEELLLVAGNGYGDGDFYGENGQIGFSPKKNAKYFIAAYEIIAKKLNLKHITP